MLPVVLRTPAKGHRRSRCLGLCEKIEISDALFDGEEWGVGGCLIDYILEQSSLSPPC